METIDTQTDQCADLRKKNDLTPHKAKNPSQKPLRIGIAGLGTVGSALCRLIEERLEHIRRRVGRTLTVCGVTARDRQKRRQGVNLEKIKWFPDPLSLAKSSDIDVFIEVMGGTGDPALACIKAALESGKHVVTANKALLATHGLHLVALAEKNSVSLNYEAAVAGGIPIIKTMREALAGNNITRVYGILNGTCNYILTRMEKEDLSFETCLKEAQALGYAESDPSLDIGGQDTAHKLALLTSIAFGTKL